MGSSLAFSNSTSKRYALALYELSKEKSELEKTENEIINLKKLLNTSVDFKNMISNPTIDKQERIKAILKIAEYFHFSQILKNFLSLIASKGRLFFLGKIIDSFLKLISYGKGELIAQLVSSKELSTEEINLIQKVLSENLSRKLIVNYSFDPNLIGGFKIQVESIMIDSSIKSKLKRLEKLMLDS